MAQTEGFGKPGLVEIMDNAEIKEIIDLLNRVHADLQAYAQAGTTSAALRIYRGRLDIAIFDIEEAISATPDEDERRLLVTLERRAKKYLQEINRRLGGVR